MSPPDGVADGDLLTREELRAFLVGSVTIAAISMMLLLSYVGTRMHHASVGDSVRIYATFNRVDGLSVGDDVEVAGVPIGRVAAASQSRVGSPTRGDKACATWR